MPLYTIACTRPSPVRAAIARAVTDAHCAVTGAPPEFVSVLFADNHPLRAPYQLSILGGIRRGGNRDHTMITTLEHRVRHDVAAASGLSTDTIDIDLLALPANWVIEGGKIMPDPGDEAHWLTT